MSSSLQNLLTDQIGKIVQDKFGPVAGDIVNTLIKQMGENASTPEGALELDTALDEHETSTISQVDNKEAQKILGHIFGNKLETTQTTIAQKYHIDAPQAEELLTKFAPVVLGMMGSQKKGQSLNTQNIMDIFTQKNADGQSSSLADTLTNMLDKDKNGSALDDVAEMFLDKNKDGAITDDLIGMAQRFLNKK